MDRRAVAAPADEGTVTSVLEFHPHLIRSVVDQHRRDAEQIQIRRGRKRRRAVRRLLTGTVVAGGALIATSS